MTDRFVVDPEYGAFIIDTSMDAGGLDQPFGLRPVGWFPEGEAWEYANRIADMLNAAERENGNG